MSGAYFSHDDTKIFYSIEGSGDPVLLIHGWTCDQNDWAFQIPFLLSLGFRVIAVDLRGHGKSTYDHGNHLQLDPATLADDLAALMVHLGYGSASPAIVAGHSLGAVVVNQLAVRHPELLRAMVLVDSSCYMTPPQMDFVIQLLEADPDNAPQAVTSFWVNAGVLTADAPVWLGPWQRRRAWAMDPSVLAATFKQMRAHLGQSGSDYLAKTKKDGIPRLVTCGRQEGAAVEREAGIDEQLDLVEVIEKGHFHHIEAHDSFNAILKRWLTERGFVSSP